GCDTARMLRGRCSYFAGVLALAAGVLSFSSPMRVAADEASADLALTVANDLGGGNATVGEPFTWTFTVSNVGDETANSTPTSGFELYAALPQADPAVVTYSVSSIVASGGATGQFRCGIGAAISNLV